MGISIYLRLVAQGNYSRIGIATNLGVAQEHLVSGTTEPSVGSRIRSITGQDLNMGAISVSSGSSANLCEGAE